MESLYGTPEDIKVVKDLGLPKELSEDLALRLKSMRRIHEYMARSSSEPKPFDAKEAIRQIAASMRAYADDTTFA